jgi:tetratricopeptide (TPR) repeat protein
MGRNIGLAASGLLLGFIIGFVFANFGGRPLSQAGGRATAQAGPSGSAPPLDPTKTNGSLPAGHPDISGGNDSAGGGGGIGSSPQAQAAMEAADKNANDFDAQMRAAAVFYELNDYEKAGFYLQRSLALKPDSVDALMAMGYTKENKGDFAGAASFYERALTLQPNDPDGLTNLGDTYARRNPPNYDRAIAEYRKALAIDPKHEGALQQTAEAALRKGDKVLAREEIERLAAVNPSNSRLASLRTEAQ